MRVGVTGADGLLGATLVPLWRRAGADVAAWTLDAFDVRDAAATRRAVVADRPDVVVHLAAWTDVDGAEADPDAALAVNRDGTAHVAAACREAGARLVVLSTDYVFDGSARRPIPPDTVPAPRGAYARSKAAAEAAVASCSGPWTILRTGWLFGPGGRNFVDTVRAAAAAGRALRVVDDQVGAPTSSRLVAEGLWGLVRAGKTGRWHLAAAGAASWFEVAREVFRAAGADPLRVTACRTAEAGRAAPRPAYSVLDCRATEAALGMALPRWEAHVAAYLATGRVPALGLIEGDA
ncbi:MAG TPA: dTDP-4-dehydrorhamnose reductase [Gemmatimonadales bacterium]|nr:dTDP-4-dehydrorhamnose reductase [Gemmatimonadales bacterium]